MDQGGFNQFIAYRDREVVGVFVRFRAPLLLVMVRVYKIMTAYCSATTYLLKYIEKMTENLPRIFDTLLRTAITPKETIRNSTHPTYGHPAISIPDWSSSMGHSNRTLRCATAVMTMSRFRASLDKDTWTV
jgi:hypothetical protein